MSATSKGGEGGGGMVFVDGFVIQFSSGAGRVTSERAERIENR